MLSRTFSLHDIKDVEAFCVSIFEARAGSIPNRDHEDAIAYLIETTWELSLEFRPGPSTSNGSLGKQRRFSVYATHILRRRLIDWQRRQYGRTKWGAPHYIERALPSLVPLESRPDGLVDGFLDHTHTGRVSDVLGLQRARGGPRARPDQEGSGSEARSAA